MSDWNVILGVLGTGMVILTTIWRFAIWIQQQFNSVKDYVDKRFTELEAKVINKIEYHEKHDDHRFAEIHNEIWQLKVLDAARNGISMSTRKEDTQ